MKPHLSIVIPVLNEEAQIATTLQALSALRERGAEILVVDGGSRDATIKLAKALADTVVQAPSGRAQQMNAGATQAKAPVLLFLHADTQLPAQADVLVTQAIQAGFGWGRFNVRIHGKPWMLRVVAALMNWRSRLTGIATGDQAIFVRKDLLESVGGFPNQALMEDIEISRRLRRLSPPACLRQRVCTSGRRWESRGVWKTIFLMWRLRWRYWRGESASVLAKAYW